MRDSRLKRTLLITSALGAGLAPITVLSLPAEAACTTYSPASGVTVDCTDLSTTGIDSASASNVTVNIGTIYSPDAQLNVSTADGIRLLGNTNTVNIRGSVAVTGDGNAGIDVNTGSTVTIFENGTISTSGDGFASSGVFLENTGHTLILEASSASTPTGIYTSGTAAHGVYTHNATVIVNSGRSIITTGDNSNAVKFLFSGVLTNYGLLSSESWAVRGGNQAAVGDTITNRGTITNTTGGTAIELRSGNDTLTLGAGSIINGGIDGGGDVDVLYLVEAGSEDSNIVNFETLIVDEGVWTLSGTSSFTTIVIDGELINSGTLTGSGGLNFAGSGSSLINTATLNATVSGGIGNDILTNFGTIAGSIDLGDGEDMLTLGLGSSISGDIDGGDGNDIVALVGGGSEDNAFSNFETLIMDGLELGLEWTLTGNQSFSSINIVDGTLTLATPAIISGTLEGNGTLNADVTSTGTVSAGNSVGTLVIGGNFTQNGGSFLVEFDSSGIDLVTATGTATLLNSPVLNIVSLDGSSSAYGVILHADLGITGSFADPPIYNGNGAATILQTANDITLIVMDGTTVEADSYASLRTAMSFFDQIGTKQAVGCDQSDAVGVQWRVMLDSECRAQIWARGFGQLGSEEASEGNKAYDYSIGGTAMGAEAVVAQDVSVGASFGYAKSEVEVKGDAGQTSIGSFMGSVHGRFERGGAFITGTVGGGHQDLDLLRTASVGAGAIDTEADTIGWLAGAGLMAGFRAQVDGGWTIAPTASLSYLHQWIDGYEEEVSTVSIEIEDHDAGLWRLKTEIEGRYSQIVGETHVAPYVKLGWVGEHGGGGTAAGSFSTGDEFKLAIGTREGVRALGGLGLDLSFASGFDAHLSYEGEVSRTSAVHSIMGGVSFVW